MLSGLTDKTKSASNGSPHFGNTIADSNLGFNPGIPYSCFVSAGYTLAFFLNG